MGPLWPASRASVSPEAASKMTHTPSVEWDSTCLPLGENDTLRTATAPGAPHACGQPAVSTACRFRPRELRQRRYAGPEAPRMAAVNLQLPAWELPARKASGPKIFRPRELPSRKASGPKSFRPEELPVLSLRPSSRSRRGRPTARDAPLAAAAR